METNNIEKNDKSSSCIHLNKRFPICKKLIFKRIITSRKCLLLILTAIGLGVIFNHTNQNINLSLELTILPIQEIFMVVGILLSAIIFVTYLQIKHWNYSIHAGNLRITHGLILRTCISIPLAKITEIYTEEDLLDRIFGMCTLHIVTPSNESSVVTKIEGLSTLGGQVLEEELEGLSLGQRKQEALGGSYGAENFLETTKNVQNFK